MQLFLGLAEPFKGMLYTYLKQYNDKYSIKNNTLNICLFLREF